MAGSDDQLQEQIRQNTVKSVLLLAGFPLVLPLAAFAFVLIAMTTIGHGDAIGMAAQAFTAVLIVIALATLVWLPIGYLTNQSIVDAATGARLVDRSEERRLWAIYESLCRNCGMRPPALRIIETDVLNAFASGLTDAQYSVTVTRGLLDALDDDELEAVLAHELSHIRNHDCRLLVVAVILVGLVPMIHDVALRVFWALVMGFLHLYRAIFTLIPIPMVRVMVTISYTAMFWVGKVAAYVIGAVGHFCSLLIHYALSRRREFMADAGAVEMTGKPGAMISALRKVACGSALDVRIDGVRQMLFDSPRLGSLFATHPAIEDRIRAIESFARTMGDRSTGNDRGPADEAISSDDEKRAPSSNDPSLVDAYRSTFLRVMGGQPELVAAERRQAIYERAQHALVDRIAGMDPPLPSFEVDRLTYSMDEAIQLVEDHVRGTLRSGQRRRA